MMKKLIVLFLAATVLTLGACNPKESPNKHKQAEKAAAVAESIKFTENAEIENIKKRLELTSKPGQIGFITLLNSAGQPIAYYSVKGKITSSGKRLTPTNVVYDFCQYRVERDAHLGGPCDAVVKAPSDEGTWGSSSPYIYFWTTGGQYIQWSGQYLYSDKPYRLSVQPLVVEVSSSSLPKKDE